MTCKCRHHWWQPVNMQTGTEEFCWVRQPFSCKKKTRRFPSLLKHKLCASAAGINLTSVMFVVCSRSHDSWLSAAGHMIHDCSRSHDSWLQRVTWFMIVSSRSHDSWLSAAGHIMHDCLQRVTWFMIVGSRLHDPWLSAAGYMIHDCLQQVTWCMTLQHIFSPNPLFGDSLDFVCCEFQTKHVKLISNITHSEYVIYKLHGARSA